MGGRGAARDRTCYCDRHGKIVKYGEEYTTLLQHGRIKFVTTKSKSDSVTAPRETRTQGRVYVTVSKGKAKYITFYRNDGRKRIQIDLDHKHNGEIPHKHMGCDHCKRGKMSVADRLLVENVKKIWNQENLEGVQLGMNMPELFKTTDLDSEHGWRWLIDAVGHVWFYIDGTYWFLFPAGERKFGLCYYKDNETGNCPRWVFNSVDEFLHAKLFKNDTCVLDRLGEFMSYEPE